MAKITPDTPLNPRQVRFCHEYVVDHSCGRAAIRAGYSKKTANAGGSAQFRRPNVRAFIDKLEDQICKALMVTAEGLAAECSNVAFSRMDDYVTIDTGGCVIAKPLDTIPKHAVGAIKKITDRRTISEGEDGKSTILRAEVTYELHDKMRALQDLMKWKGMLVDRHKVEVLPPQRVIVRDTTGNIVTDIGATDA